METLATATLITSINEWTLLNFFKKVLIQITFYISTFQ